MGLNHFIIFGFGKAGSTYIYEFCKRHPQITVPKIKETYYFNLNWRMGQRWYVSLFNHSPGAKAYGDFSNQNYRYSETLQNLKNFDERSRVIFLDRDPLDRLISARKFELMNGSTASIEEFISEWPYKFLQSEQVYNSILENFHVDAVLRLKFSDLKADPERVCDLLCKFLKVDSIKPPTDIYKNKSVFPRYKFVVRIGKKIAVKLRNVGALHLLQILKSSVLIRRLVYSKSTLELPVAEIEKLKIYVEEMDHV